MKELVDLRIMGLCQDSRRVKPGDLFFALSGFTVDGRKFIPNAIENGASAVLMQEDFSLKSNNEFQYNKFPRMSDVPVIPYSDLKNAVGYIADCFYSMPSALMKVIGITGTNGKTSCSHYIAQLMTLLGTSCGVMGTLGTGFLQNLKYIEYTTADAILTHEALAEIYERGASAVAMEVTSHGLTQGRVNGVRFHTAIFTNLTRDHLDYHENMEEYFAAKKKLFLEFNPKFKIINLDDEYGQLLWEELQLNEMGSDSSDSSEKIKAKKNWAKQSEEKDGDTVNDQTLIGYKTKLNEKNKVNEGNEDLFGNILYVDDHILDENGTSATLHSPWGIGKLYCPLLGHFNLSNVLAAIAALCIQGFPLELVLEAVSKLETVDGRMLRLGGGNNEPVIIVDFAHKPDALSNVLQTLKPLCQGALWCVFGCGGDRDTGKRPMMAQIAERFCDHIVVTQDNPRTENPQKIIDDILSGFHNDLMRLHNNSEFHTNGIGIKKTLTVEPDRRAAIHVAIRSAGSKDIIVIAGKGHETHQIIGHEKIPFSDRLVALEALQERALNC